MIVLRTPKGWTGPKEVDGLPVEGTFRSHQVPLAERRATTPSTCAQLEDVAALATGPRSCSTTTARSRAELARARARRASAG